MKERETMKQMTRITLAVIALFSALVPAHAQEQKPRIVHDAEYYILEAQHGQEWAAEDKELDAKLTELKAKFGTPPNIIHVMWDDTAVGEVGIPAIQKVRGFETPNITRSHQPHDCRKLLLRPAAARLLVASERLFSSAIFTFSFQMLPATSGS
jgi:hypothetical protein